MISSEGAPGHNWARCRADPSQRAMPTGPGNPGGALSPVGRWVSGDQSRMCSPCACVCARSFSRAWLSVTPWTVPCQAPLPLGFSRQGYWSGWPCPPQGDLPGPGIEPRSPAAPALQVDSLPLSHRPSPVISLYVPHNGWIGKGQEMPSAGEDVKLCTQDACMFLCARNTSTKDKKNILWVFISKASFQNMGFCSHCHTLWTMTFPTGHLSTMPTHPLNCLPPFVWRYPHDYPFIPLSANPELSRLHLQARFRPASCS